MYLSTYAKMEYVSVRTYLSKNRIRMLRIHEPSLNVKAANTDLIRNRVVKYIIDSGLRGKQHREQLAAGSWQLGRDVSFR